MDIEDVMLRSGRNREGVLCGSSRTGSIKWGDTELSNITNDC